MGTGWQYCQFSCHAVNRSLQIVRSADAGFLRGGQGGSEGLSLGLVAQNRDQRRGVNG